MEKLTLEVTGKDRAAVLKALQEAVAYVQAGVSKGTVRIYENQYQWSMKEEVPTDPPSASPDDQQEGQP